MTDCVIGEDLRCAKCGRSAKVRHLRRRCTSYGPPRPVKGLGDIVADALASVGITKERAQAVASAVGVDDCGCKERQAAMNAWGAKHLGIGTDAAKASLDQ
jgi:hypothetical protein